MKKLNFGGHLGRHLEFHKTLKGAKPSPNGILKSNGSPFRKYQNIFYTPPCHVVLGISQTILLKKYCLLTTTVSCIEPQHTIYLYITPTIF